MSFTNLYKRAALKQYTKPLARMIKQAKLVKQAEEANDKSPRQTQDKDKKQKPSATKQFFHDYSPAIGAGTGAIGGAGLGYGLSAAFGGNKVINLLSAIAGGASGGAAGYFIGDHFKDGATKQSLKADSQRLYNEGKKKVKNLAAKGKSWAAENPEAAGAAIGGIGGAALGGGISSMATDSTAIRLLATLLGAGAGGTGGYFIGKDWNKPEAKA